MNTNRDVCDNFINHALAAFTLLAAEAQEGQHSEVVHVGELVRRAVDPLQIPIEIKRQRLEIHGHDDASFTGDLNWSAEALTNVVKNCIEHTPEGGRIEITYAANALYAEIIVSDDSKGIASREIWSILTTRRTSALDSPDRRQVSGCTVAGLTG